MKYVPYLADILFHIHSLFMEVTNNYYKIYKSIELL